MRQHRGQAGERELHVAAEQVGHCLRGAFIRDVHESDAGHIAEQRARKIGGRTVAGRCVVQLTGLRFRERAEFLDVGGRQAGIRGEYQRSGADDSNRREIALAVVWHRFDEAGIGCDGTRDEDHRVTVGRCLDREFGAYDAVRARPVVDDDLVVDILAQVLRDEPRHDVGVAAGSVRHDQAQGPRREISGGSGCAAACQQARDANLRELMQSVTGTCAHSMRTPASLMTFAHFGISSRTRFANSGGPW